MNAVRTLCNHCIWLVKGEKFSEGDPKELVSQYMTTGQDRPLWTSDDPEPRLIQNEYFMPTRFSAVDENLEVLKGPVTADQKVGILIEGNSDSPNSSLSIGFSVFAASGELMFQSLHGDTERSQWPEIHKGSNRLIAWLPTHFLNEGEYRIELMSSLHFQRWLCEPGINSPSIRMMIRGGLSQSPMWLQVRPGLTAPIIPFTQLA
jgi:lipopolysaccharide transport system ATP-binding protein